MIGVPGSKIKEGGQEIFRPRPELSWVDIQERTGLGCFRRQTANVDDSPTIGSCKVSHIE